MDEKILINLRMADGIFPLRIRPEEEERARKAAKRVDERLRKYRAQYPKESADKLLAMTAYQFALENLGWEGCNDTAPYAAKVEELTTVLEDYFRGE